MNLILKKLSIFACCLLIFQNNKAALDAREEIRQLSSALSAKFMKDDFGIKKIIKERNPAARFSVTLPQNNLITFELPAQEKTASFSLLPSEIKVEIIKQLIPSKIDSQTQLLETLESITNFAVTNRENFNCMQDNSESIIKIINNRTFHLLLFDNITNIVRKKKIVLLPVFQENLIFGSHQYLFFKELAEPKKRIQKFIDKNLLPFFKKRFIEFSKKQELLQIFQLEEKGFNGNLRIIYMESLLERVMQFNNLVLFKKVIGSKNCVNNGVLYHALFRGSYEIASYILDNFTIEKISNLNVLSIKNIKYLSFKPIIKKMISKGVNVDIMIREPWGHKALEKKINYSTLLILAIENSDIEMVKFLLDQNASPTKTKKILQAVTPEIDQSPLEIAQKIGNQEIIRLLQEALQKCS